MFIIVFIILFFFAYCLGRFVKGPKLYTKEVGSFCVFFNIIFCCGILLGALSILCYCFIEIGSIPVILAIVIGAAIFLGFKYGYKEMDEDLAIEEEQIATGNKIKKKGLCPWCNTEVRAIIREENTFRRDVCICPECGKRILKCRMCENYARGGRFWDDEFCPKCGPE